jgi:LmbE family N-acetylglucosaminyl deacetylase
LYWYSTGIIILSRVNQEPNPVITWPDSRHIYLSPHLDDVVLSCGGAIYRQTRRGEPVAVITIFAGSPEPPAPLPSFARSLHQRWQHSAPPGIDFSDPPAVRREEDRRAFAAISPDIQVIHLTLPDCIYRLGRTAQQPLYNSVEALFGAIHSDDPAPLALTGIPPPPADAILYVPLGAGSHVDHQIVRQAVGRWQADQAQLCYYEDYPYAANPEAVAKTLTRGAWEPTTIPLDDDALNAKIRAIAEHASQISTFWHSAEAMETAIREYFTQVGGEWLWKNLLLFKGLT